MTEFDSPFPSVDIKKNKKKILAARILLKSLIYSFAIFGILFILLLIVVISMLKPQSAQIIPVPDQAVLSINFDDNYSETRSDDLLAEVTGVRSQTFLDLIKAINIAAGDDRIKAISATVSNTGLGLAQIQDLRDAVFQFRKSGKKAYLFSGSFGSFGQGTRAYYLATAFDEIWMQPNAEAGITGLALEVPFFKKVLDKIGVTPEFYQRYEYKTAMASLTEEKMSDAYRSELNRLGKDIFGRIVSDIASARKTDEQKVVRLINQAPLSAKEALEAGLIDRIGFRQDLTDELKAATGAEYVDVMSYAASLKSFGKSVPAVAFMTIDGVIAEGPSYRSPVRDEAITGADTVLADIEQIVEDDGVKALVLRINSPGGSYGASNEIWYALKQLKLQKKIPIVVSMGDYAASGGYFVALSGDYIMVEPSTITGSIGVLGGKMVLEGLWKKLGVSWERISFGENAGILSSNQKFSKSEKNIFNKSLDRVYEDFTLKVSEARKINLKEMDKLARGRVWTGEGAVENGLADGLGGIEAAVAKAQELAEMKPGEKFRLVYYPREKSFQEKIQLLINSGKGIYVKRMLSEAGIETETYEGLRRLRFDAVLPPLKIVF